VSHDRSADAGPATSIDSHELAGRVGETFSAPHAVVVTERMVHQFAALSGADHWMHVDAERAQTSPLGRSTVQGLLTLSLGALLEKHVLVVQAQDAVLYGVDRVRFPAPMFVGDPVRLEIDVVSAQEQGDGVVARLQHRYVSAGPKPVCVAQQIVRYTHNR
jgi:acyl dehydratase